MSRSRGMDDSTRRFLQQEKSNGAGVVTTPIYTVRQHDGQSSRQQRDRSGDLIKETRDTLRDKPIALHPVTHYDRSLDHSIPGGDDHIKMFMISSADYSQRLAKKQVEHRESKALQQAEGCVEYNIWYGKWIGEHWSTKGDSMLPAPTRCSVRQHAGRTKADERLGGVAYCCVFFARGCCAAGADCTFVHRIPSPADEARLDTVRDIFGRERHNTNRDDMRGTGNFNRESRTLYIGGLKMLGGSARVYQVLLRHLSEWGEVEQCRVIPSKAIAFVTYKLRSAAEFALEALHCQSLDLDELLNVRWAYDDPNPKVRAMIEQKHLDQLREAVESQGYDTTDVDFYHPPQYDIRQVLPAKRARQEGASELGSSVCCEYPLTDSQYDHTEYGYLQQQSSTTHTHTPHTHTPHTHTGGSSSGGAQNPQRREGDWDCPTCYAHVLASVNYCFKCQTPKPSPKQEKKKKTEGGNGVQPLTREAAEAAEAEERERDAAQAQRTKALEAQRKLEALLDGVDGSSWKEGGGGGDEEAWEEYFDEQGRRYYHCERSGETRWEKPVGGRGGGGIGEGGGSSRLEGEQAEVWQEYVDEQGRKYYYCATSGETRWQKPAMKDGAPESTTESAAASARAKLELAVDRARDEGCAYRERVLAASWTRPGGGGGASEGVGSVVGGGDASTGGGPGGIGGGSGR